jgi:hypothetical protein
MPKTTHVPRVVIDDLRTHHLGGLHLRSSKEALDWFAANSHVVIDELWLDHDLGYLDKYFRDTDTIRSVVHYLEERCFNNDPVYIRTIYVHSGNPVGATWIMSSNILNENYPVLRATMAELSA